MTNEIKRYILLAGQQYYPNRWEDFRGTFNTVAEAQSYALSQFSRGPNWCGWAQIIDTLTMEVVSETYNLSDSKVTWGLEYY